MNRAHNPTGEAAGGRAAVSTLNRGFPEIPYWTWAATGATPVGYRPSPAFGGSHDARAAAGVAMVSVVVMLTGIPILFGIDTLFDPAPPSDIERLVRTPSGVWPLAVDPPTGEVLLLTDPQLT